MKVGRETCEAMVERWWDFKKRKFADAPRPCCNDAHEELDGKSLCGKHHKMALAREAKARAILPLLREATRPSDAEFFVSDRQLRVVAEIFAPWLKSGITSICPKSEEEK